MKTEMIVVPPKAATNITVSPLEPEALTTPSVLMLEPER